MQSAASPQWVRSPDDLTARARLRDAAIDCFAQRGFAASVREIAQRAGVSQGLIRHHFGGKDNLRAECDEEVFRRFREIKGEGLAMSPGQAIGMLSQLEEFGPTFVYILRSVLDGGVVGRAFVEHLIVDTELFMEQAVRAGTVRESRDPSGRARYLVTSALGSMLVQLTLSPEIDLSDVGNAIQRLTGAFALPSLELFTEGLFVDRSMLDQYLMQIPDPPAAGRDIHPPA
ncbi:MAG: TetR family transcriptional regulator [Salinibacterium sp.]|nr:TetR family transcriptional regulator [Salinibacterium sp.]